MRRREQQTWRDGIQNWQRVGDWIDDKSESVGEAVIVMQNGDLSY